MNNAHRSSAPSGRVEYTVVDSPLGKILVAGTSEGLRHLAFQDGTAPLVPGPAWEEAPEAFREVRDQLERYFAGQLREFDLRLDPGGTPFQAKVWSALREIPYGHTASYAEIARAIGSPNAARAVGAANALNPLPLIVPCHRVIGSSGRLTGYRGGIELKRRLLELERAAKTQPSPRSPASRSAASRSAQSRQRLLSE